MIFKKKEKEERKYYKYKLKIELMDNYVIEKTLKMVTVHEAREIMMDLIKDGLFISIENKVVSPYAIKSITCVEITTYIMLREPEAFLNYIIEDSRMKYYEWKDELND